jgi:CNT family concentrative nucleoside transporter
MARLQSLSNGFDLARIGCAYSGAGANPARQNPFLGSPRLLINLAGIVAILLIAFALSTSSKRIRLRVVGAAFVLQAAMALFILRTPWGVGMMQGLTRGVTTLLGYSGEGTRFIFGDLASPELGGASFALQALTVIVFFASLVAVLDHLGIIGLVVRWIGGAIRVITGVSRVESLTAAANIFIGQGEAPLVVRNYLANMSRAQLFTVMVVGMTSVAGSVMAAYIAMLGSEVAPYLLAAALMSAPGGVLMAKLIMPDEEDAAEPERVAVAEGQSDEGPANVIMAAADGAYTGLKLSAAVGAMLLAFISLVALANGLLGAAGSGLGIDGLSFEGLLGYAFSPIMYLIGIPWSEAQIAGGLFGQKLVLNEFVAFLSLQDIQQTLSPRSVAVTSFALCGFANFSSIAIQMAAFGSLAPNKKANVARLGLRALAAASLANLMSAALAGLFIAA